jgi:drug/metabolite transporter (DMT)-like permease
LQLPRLNESGALFLHEELTWKVGIGAAFVALGAAIMVM